MASTKPKQAKKSAARGRARTASKKRTAGKRQAASKRRTANKRRTGSKPTPNTLSEVVRSAKAPTVAAGAAALGGIVLGIRRYRSRGGLAKRIGEASKSLGKTGKELGKEMQRLGDDAESVGKNLS
jgi:sRNA-binding protein